MTLGGVIDEADPTANALTPARRKAGQRTVFQAFAADNLDLDRVDGFIAFGTSAADAYQHTSEDAGSRWLPLERAGTVTGSIDKLPASIATDASTALPLSGYLARVLDHAGNDAYDFAWFAAADAPANLNILSGAQPTDEAGRAIAYSSPAVSIPTDANALCWDTDNDGCNNNARTSTAITFTLNGAETLSGTPAPTSDVNRVVHPFDRVVVYVRLAEDLAGDAVGAVWAELGEAGGRPPTNNPDNDDATIDRQFQLASLRASFRPGNGCRPGGPGGCGRPGRGLGRRRAWGSVRHRDNRTERGWPRRLAEPEQQARPEAAAPGSRNAGGASAPTVSVPDRAAASGARRERSSRQTPTPDRVSWTMTPAACSGSGVLLSRDGSEVRAALRVRGSGTFTLDAAVAGGDPQDPPEDDHRSRRAARYPYRQGRRTRTEPCRTHQPEG